MGHTFDDLLRSKWRELGFYYSLDSDAGEWRLVGSREGLLRFRDLLMDYAATPARASKSEHDHYGPYSYLEIMTWPEAGMDGHAIFGTLDDLRRLAGIVARLVSAAQPGDSLRITTEYAPSPEFALILDVREDGFDPVSEDSQLRIDG